MEVSVGTQIPGSKVLLARFAKLPTIAAQGKPIAPRDVLTVIKNHYQAEHGRLADGR
jgi:hypothetical protein